MRQKQYQSDGGKRTNKGIYDDARFIRNSDRRNAARPGTFFLGFFNELSQYDEQIELNIYGLPTWSPAGIPGPRTVAEFVDINWWIRDTGVQYLILADGNPAGYGLVFTRQSAFDLPEGTDQELFDFYIAPKYRRRGVGEQAAKLILTGIAGYGRFISWRATCPPAPSGKKLWTSTPVATLRICATALASGLEIKADI